MSWIRFGKVDSRTLAKKRKTRQRPWPDPRLSSAALRPAEGRCEASELFGLSIPFVPVVGAQHSFTLSHGKGCAPFGKEMHPKKQTPEDLDPRILPVTRIR